MEGQIQYAQLRGGGGIPLVIILKMKNLLVKKLLIMYTSSCSTHEMFLSLRVSIMDLWSFAKKCWFYDARPLA